MKWDRKYIKWLKDFGGLRTFKHGIQHGASSFQGNQYEVTPNNSESPKKTQEQLAAQMGISVDTLQNYKMLAENKILRLLCRREFCISGIFIRLMGWFINI